MQRLPSIHEKSGKRAPVTPHKDPLAEDSLLQIDHLWTSHRHPLLESDNPHLGGTTPLNGILEDDDDEVLHM